MQFEIEKNTISKVQITVEAPAYYCYWGICCFLTTDCIIVVSKNEIATYEANTHLFGVYLQNIHKYGEPLSRERFDIEFNNKLKCLTEQYRERFDMEFNKFKCLTEQYQLKTAMNYQHTDPKDGQQEEATQETQAAETQATEEKATEETKAEGE